MKEREDRDLKDIPAAQRYFGEVAENYDERRNRKRATAEDQRIVETWISTLKNGSVIADVPVGTGRFLEAMMDQGLQVKGYDISDAMIRQAEEKLKAVPEDRRQTVELNVADARELPLPDKSVDYLLSVKFIKWLPSDALVAEVLAEFRRVCRQVAVIQVKVDKGEDEAGVRGMFRRLKGRIKTASKGNSDVTARVVTHEVFLGLAERSGFRVDHWVDNPELARKSSAVRFYFLLPQVDKGPV